MLAFARIHHVPLRHARRMSSTTAVDCGIVWYKCNDLRVRDHEPLLQAHTECKNVLHVFVFDPFWFGTARESHLPKCGPYKGKFLLESIADLRKSLRGRGSELIVRTGGSVNVLATIAAATGATAVYTHKEVCSEEQTIVSNVECAMNRLPRKCTLKTYWGGHTLYHVDDLPFNAQKDLPDVYSSFRRKVEERCKVRSPLPAPGTLRPQPIGFDDKLGDPAAMPLANGVIARGANDGAGKLPSLEALGAADLRPVYAALGIRDPFGSAAVASGAGTASGPSSSSPVAAASNDNDDFWSEYAPPPSASASAAASSAAASGTIDDEVVWSLPSCIDKRSVLQFRGGETAAVQRLKEYIWDSDSLRSYKETRNGLLGPNYSSKFSVWLAFGCVSPRSIFAEVAEYEKKVVANESTYWLVFELLWRDFMRFYGLKHGDRIFYLWGPRNDRDASKSWKRDAALLASWSTGTTGYPFVDANMRELLLTGFMSNRGRQNVASFLVKDMEVDWRLGAELFECLLLDHDPCSNYGNWTYVAGVGADPREDRYFLIPKQSRDYDPKADYMRHWLPFLSSAPTDALHDPVRLSEPIKSKGKYPSPVVQLLAQRQGRGPRSNAAGGGGGKASTAAGGGASRSHGQQQQGAKESGKGATGSSMGGGGRQVTLGAFVPSAALTSADTSTAAAPDAGTNTAATDNLNVNQHGKGNGHFRRPRHGGVPGRNRVQHLPEL